VDESKLNVDSAVKYWISQGAPINKIVVGLAANGHSFKLADQNSFTPGSLSIGAGNAGLVILLNEFFFI
jgi:hypothetical protein